MTVAFMLPRIGLLFPLTIGYNLYQYTIFRCKLIGKTRAGGTRIS